MTTAVWTPEDEIWTPEFEFPEWAKKAGARTNKFVAAAIYGGASGGLDEEVTAARWLSDTFQTGPPTDTNTFNVFARGYAGDGADYFNSSGINEGSITGDTFDDNGGTSRTLEHIAYYESDGGITLPEDGMVMGWTGASITNDADTFYSIEVEDNVGGMIEYIRTSATYDASQSGMTMWIWEHIAHNSHFLTVNNPATVIINLTA